MKDFVVGLAIVGSLIVVVALTVSTIERKSRIWRIDTCVEKYKEGSQERNVCLRGY